MTDLTMSQFASKDDLLAAQAARIAELESQLEAIGAGGVESLRKPAAAPQAVQAAVPEGWKLVPAKPTEAMVGAIMSEGEVDAVAGLAPELRPILLERAGIAARYTAMLAAAPAHPAEGVPAQCPNINEPRGCWRVACQLGGKCREPERSATQPAAQGMDAEIQQAVEAERERICAAIKAEDDHCVDQGDYMLDSNDCIKIVRGKWVRPDYSLDAAQAKQGGA
ncbi:hypothetical protein N5D37_05265 [Comamonas aquatica]|uniref:hypothetical protein n=1 Tax=Comamonas aquatica TaxID=225991 RepID=UPI00244A8ABA|nr:hypothetical protein [Comamonas aquatica]MDH1765117.1 hypothetical protein [Comamonas aquatica]